MRLRIGGTALTWTKRAATAALLALIGLLVFDRAREMDWGGVAAALESYRLTAVGAAFAIGLPAFVACACFDLIGRHATGHGLAVRRVMLISFTGYYFSLNLGALIGGLAFRYRLYVPYGLPAMTISQIIGMSVLTNWSGYVLVAGAVLVYQPPDLPPGWSIGAAPMRVLGGALLAIAAGYFAVCAVRGGTRVQWKGSVLRLPTVGVAAVQVALSIVSWGGIGAVIAWLLPGDAGWLAVMPVLMISAIAGIWSHIPSGLGVIEVVFLALLGHRVAESELLAGLLVFRAVYYLVPFALAIVAYAYLEATAGRVGPVAPGGTQMPDDAEAPDDAAPGDAAPSGGARRS